MEDPAEAQPESLADSPDQVFGPETNCNCDEKETADFIPIRKANCEKEVGVTGRRRSVSESGGDMESSTQIDQCLAVKSSSPKSNSMPHLDNGNSPSVNKTTANNLAVHENNLDILAPINESPGLVTSPSLGSTLSEILVDKTDPIPSVGEANSSGTDPGLKLGTGVVLGCEMCANYEVHLQQLQDQEHSIKQQLAAAQHLADRYHTELSSERLARVELETKMAQLSVSSQEQVRLTTEGVSAMEVMLKNLQDQFSERMNAAEQEFSMVAQKQVEAEHALLEMTQKHDKLLGKHRQHSQAMRGENIDLPQSLDELQLLCLQLREELIESRAAKEHLEDSLKGDIMVVQEQMTAEKHEKEQLEESLTEEVNQLRTELGLAKSQVSELEESNRHAENLETRLAEFQTTISDLESKLGSLQMEKGELEFTMKEYRMKGMTLQQELDNSEAVQKDFVKLSQSLQIELEKIRQAEQEVRWQHEDDVFICNGCKQPFTKARTKNHCSHCGKVFCDACLPKSVPSGPQRRPTKVCEVCHTLLVRNTAPYFSQQVPHAEVL